MVWTRLYYIKDLSKAMKAYKPHQPRQQLVVGGRYRNILKNQFRANGVPWIYDLTIPGPDKKDLRPKTPKYKKIKEERIEKIKKNLLEADDKILEHRQNHLNKRKLAGYDKLIAKAFPSFIKASKENIPAYLRKNKGEDFDFD